MAYANLQDYALSSLEFRPVEKLIRHRFQLVVESTVLADVRLVRDDPEQTIYLDCTLGTFKCISERWISHLYFEEKLLWTSEDRMSVHRFRHAGVSYKAVLKTKLGRYSISIWPFDLRDEEAATRPTLLCKSQLIMQERAEFLINDFMLPTDFQWEMLTLCISWLLSTHWRDRLT